MAKKELKNCDYIYIYLYLIFIHYIYHYNLVSLVKTFTHKQNQYCKMAFILCR